MRKTAKLAVTPINTLNPDMTTARFENVKTRSFIDESNYEEIDIYDGIKVGNYKTDGNEKLSKFRERLIGMRTQLKMYTAGTVAEGDEIGFSVYLKVKDEEKQDEYFYIQVIVYRKGISVTNGTSTTTVLGEDEYAKIVVKTSIQQDANDTNTYCFGMKDLVVDSDIDDRIWRFVGENEWRSTTYLVLDLNKNLAINKGAYLTIVGRF